MTRPNAIQILVTPTAGKESDPTMSVTPLKKSDSDIPVMVTPVPPVTAKSDIMMVTPLPVNPPESTVSSYPDPRKMRSSTTEDKSSINSVYSDSSDSVLVKEIEVENSGQSKQENSVQWTSRVSYDMDQHNPSRTSVRRRLHNYGKHSSQYDFIYRMCLQIQRRQFYQNILRRKDLLCCLSRENMD